MAFMISLCKRLTMGLGVPAGANTAQFNAVNSSTITNANGYDRFMAFKVSVNGKVRYGLIERGLDQGSRHTPFLFIHTQQ